MEQNLEETIQLTCGLIMPIAPMPGYDSNQFSDVKEFLINAITEIKKYNFKTRLVSDSDGEIDIIHKSIVNNINKDPIVICDISGRNGNVMLELGLRLAFDKPVIIIKDNKTDYMFDINMIKHLEYPSDLRHNKMLLFKEELKSAVISTYEASLNNPEYSPFLKHFRDMKIEKSSIGEDTISISEALSKFDSQLSNISDRLYSIEKNNTKNIDYKKNHQLSNFATTLNSINDVNNSKKLSDEEFSKILNKYRNIIKNEDM
ncbi:hypothetical protein CU005_1837 [Enterococcus faecium]|uniref:hypothetical protein n=1 Tax=Enterococcus faecium TaxID=1352 RepID=UPI000A3FE57E|nr:hypothetical protein [Enterococcus faecium]MBK4848581.1 hypothetical protein [Enterococcus faecium]MBK4868284.1 hypothetical protein [Enterococcus faecium]